MHTHPQIQPIMKIKAILAGASGSIGSSLLQQLLESDAYSEVLVLVRKDLGIIHPKLKQLILNFKDINKYTAQINGDVVFCCLGTTKKNTPDEDDYKKIDYQYPLDLAWIAQVNGATGYHMISSIGADKDSAVFYTRTKGEVERDLKAVPFKSLHIYRPSLLNGKRKEKRLAEKVLNSIMWLLNPLLFGRLKKYRSIKVETVACAMLRLALKDDHGVWIHESDAIQEAGSFNKANESKLTF
jgi:uncharacterized protein YbjT (DUF2867 family)